MILDFSILPVFPAASTIIMLTPTWTHFRCSALQCAAGQRQGRSP
jgi:hypothetical protein